MQPEALGRFPMLAWAATQKNSRLGGTLQHLPVGAIHIDLDESDCLSRPGTTRSSCLLGAGLVLSALRKRSIV